MGRESAFTFQVLFVVYTGYHNATTIRNNKIEEYEHKVIGSVVNILDYSGNKKYVNPLDLPGFRHKLVIKFDLIFI